MGFDLASIFGKGVQETITSLGNIADKFITTKAEKEQFKLEAEKAITEANQKAQDQAQVEIDGYLKDIQSARNREIQVNSSESASWLSKNTLGLLAIGITVGFFGMLTYMCTNTIPKDNERILDIMLGSLGSAWIGVVSYYFGSSMGSAKSGEALRQIAKDK